MSESMEGLAERIEHIEQSLDRIAERIPYELEKSRCAQERYYDSFEETKRMIWEWMQEWMRMQQWMQEWMQEWMQTQRWMQGWMQQWTQQSGKQGESCEKMTMRILEKLDQIICEMQKIQEIQEMVGEENRRLMREVQNLLVNQRNHD